MGRVQDLIDLNRYIITSRFTVTEKDKYLGYTPGQIVYKLWRASNETGKKKYEVQFVDENKLKEIKEEHYIPDITIENGEVIYDDLSERIKNYLKEKLMKSYIYVSRKEKYSAFLNDVEEGISIPGLNFWDLLGIAMIEVAESGLWVHRFKYKDYHFFTCNYRLLIEKLEQYVETSSYNPIGMLDIEIV